ncbi:MAG: YaaL family protein [Defluviitaleaceae bacterium]|nr:YaaL family protein [Defluviitaleaceae bacterium]
MVYSTAKKISAKSFVKKYGIEPEDAELLDSLHLVKVGLATAHRSFDIATDKTLLDSISYEIMSLNKKYEYYLRRCKERGLVGSVDFAGIAKLF